MSRAARAEHAAETATDGGNALRRESQVDADGRRVLELREPGHRRPAIGPRHGDIELRQAERRERDHSLADGERHDLVVVRPVAEAALPVVFAGGERGADLARQVDAGGAGDAEPAAELEEALEADADADLIEVDVARVLDRADQVLVAVAPAVPAAGVAPLVAHAPGARDRHDVIGLEHAEIHRHRRRHELERRARRLRCTGGAVEQRLARIAAEPLPDLRVDAPHEPVGIEGRRTVEREHAAGRRIERDERAAHAFGEDLRHVPLEIQVEVEREIAPRDGRQVALLRQPALDAPECIHFEVAHAGLAADQALVVTLDPSLPDPAPLPVAPEFGQLELGFADLRDVADQVRDGVARRVMAPRVLEDEHAGEQEAPLLQARHAPGRGVGGDHHGQVRLAAIAREREPDLPVGQAEHGLQPRELREHRVHGRGHQEHLVAHDVLGHDLPVAVVDRAARRGHDDGPDPVLLGDDGVLVRCEDLEPAQRERERGDGHGEGDAGNLTHPLPIEARALRARPCAHRSIPEDDAARGADELAAPGGEGDRGGVTGATRRAPGP